MKKVLWLFILLVVVATTIKKDNNGTYQIYDKDFKRVGYMKEKSSNRMNVYDTNSNRTGYIKYYPKLDSYRSFEKE